MKRRYSLRRRLLLQAMLLGVAAASSAGGFALVTGAFGGTRRGLAERVARCLNQDPQVSALGAGYVGLVGREASVAHLLERIGERWPSGVPGLARLSARSLRLALAGIALRDFSRADVVLVDGWVLARSEARVYALAHLVRRI